MQNRWQIPMDQALDQVVIRCNRLKCPRLDCPPAYTFPIRIITTPYRCIAWPLWSKLKHGRLDNLAWGHLSLSHTGHYIDCVYIAMEPVRIHPCLVTVYSSMSCYGVFVHVLLRCIRPCLVTVYSSMSCYGVFVHVLLRCGIWWDRDES